MNLDFVQLNQDKKEVLKRMIDLAERSERNHTVEDTIFMTPDLIAYVPSILFHFRDLSFRLEGGYEDAEYQKVVIYPDYLIDVEEAIAIIEMTYDPQYGEIGHRDALGALLGLGVKRDVVGDIISEPGRLQAVVSKDISEYLLSQIYKIGRIHVSSSIVEQLDYTPPAFELKSSTVKSLRLDAVVASAYNMSRQKAVDLIKGERVKVNHQYVTQTSKELIGHALISVRGKGRFRLEVLDGMTKKDRYRIQVKHYI